MLSKPARRHADPNVLEFGIGPGRFAALLLVLIVAAFPDVIFGGRTFVHRDFGIFGYPLAFHHRESFWGGTLPLWNPLNNCGLPFLAQWNTMVLYPLSVVYLLFPLTWSLGAFCLLHLLLAGLGMYFLAREWSRHSLAAAVAGLAFAFNGLALSCLKWPNNIAAWAWMPWVIWLAQLAWRRGGRHISWAALAGACQMLSGGPEMILFTWIILGSFLLIDAIPDGIRAAVAWKSWAARFLGLVLLVTGLSGAQLLPFLELLGHSQRDAAFADASWSMPWWGLANFFVPLFGSFPSHQGVFAQHGQYWTSSYYVPAGTVALSALSLLLVRDRKVWGCAVIAAAGLWLALGEQTFLYRWARDLIPLIQVIRFPIKFVVPVLFCLPLLAAMALAKFLASSEASPTPGAARQERPASRIDARLWSGVVATLILVLLAILWFGRALDLPKLDWPATWKNGLVRAAFLILVGGIVLRLRVPASNSARSLAGLGLLVILWLDVMTHAPRLTPAVERWVYEPGLAREQLALQPQPQAGASRVLISPFADFRLNHLALTNATEDFLYSRLSMFSNANLLDALPKIDGFFSLYVREEAQVRSLLYAATNALRPSLNKFLGVSHVSSDENPIAWHAQTNFQPLITAGQQPLFADAPGTLAALASESFDPARHFFLPVEARGQISATQASPATVSEARFTPHQIEFTVEAAQPAWVVIAQTSYPSWRAYVDGTNTVLWRANHAFQALEVPAGRHRVSLVYRDRTFLWGSGISAASLIACLVIGVRSRPARYGAISGFRAEP